MVATLLLALAAAPFQAPTPAPPHPEIVVGRDAKGRLVARFDGARVYPLGPSRFVNVVGFAEAMPGINSTFTARPDDDLFVLDEAADLEFVLVGADAGLAVWNDRGTGLMKAGESFSLGHPPFDSHPVWNAPHGEPGRRYELRLQLRDRSRRYGESAILSPAFTPDETPELYACPMNCKGGSTYAKSGACPVCGMQLKRLSGRSYRVAVDPDGTAPERPIAPGTDVDLAFHLATPDGKPVDDLAVVHEKLLHLLMVSDDLAWFAHEHPVLQRDGSFTLRTRFPHGGAYTLFHDFTPSRAGMQVVPVALTVAGEAPPNVPLVPDADRARTVDGCRIEMVAPSPIRSLFNLSFRVRVTREGAPVTDLEPYLGTFGHLIVVREDRQYFVHSHPLGATPAAGAHGGPDVTFGLLFPAPGRYKAWFQLQRSGSVLTAPFVFDVVAP
jgi:heavy metal-binding protein